MSSLRIEHVNIAVADPDRTVGLMEALFGWHVRWRGQSQSGGYAVHVGSNDHYLALTTRDDADHAAEAFTKGRPLNHIGVEVDDLDATEARVVAAGLKPSITPTMNRAAGSIFSIKMASSLRFLAIRTSLIPARKTIDARQRPSLTVMACPNRRGRHRAGHDG